ncbi:helix-turn-helix domain-containing protein [Glutamicibacter creatinolyticus]|uniref:helix-turn-helix domain-containing protein n=1 Tax=Glutamicibacter creatinolyticus TaxID=162496 RepID=UPI003216BAA4
MELFGAPDTSELKSDSQWIGLIRQLRERKSQLVEDFKTRFPAEHLYAEKVSPRELTALIESTMEMYLVLLAGNPLDRELESLPFELGRRRARQGVPPQQLLEGVRTNSRVIWNALREVAAEDSLAALVRNTDAVLGLVEWHVRAVQSSYLREEEILARHNEHRRNRRLGKLFGTPTPDRGEATAIALDLGVQSNGIFDMVTQLGAHDLDCLICPAAPAGVFVHELPEGTCHFAPTALAAFEKLPSQRHFARLISVKGLLLVPDAARAGLALLESRAAHAPTVVDLDRAWPALAWKTLTAIVNPRLLPVDIEKLAALAPHDRRRLLQTVATYCGTGSIKETAAAHFCHRNTVVKRLARFEALTGIDLSVPLQAALAIVATASIDAE